MNGKKSFVGFVLFVVVFSSTFAATKNKDLKWRNMKPLQTIDSENVISVANSSEKKNGLFIAKISEEKQMAIFFTPEEGKYGYPLANKNNKRLLLAKFDPKTQMVGDGICVEVPEDWKSVISIANGFFVVPSYDSKQGNSLVWIDEENWTFKTVSIPNVNISKGILDWYNQNSSSDFYYYFWDAETKKLGAFSSESGSITNTGYKLNDPTFLDIAKESDSVTYIVCSDTATENNAKKIVGDIYLCATGRIVLFKSQ
jgi:hypothetical protein